MKTSLSSIIVIISLIALFVPDVAHAGGWHLRGKITAFKVDGPNQYTIQFEKVEDVEKGWPAFVKRGEPLIIHSDFMSASTSQEQHIECLNMLLDCYHSGEFCHFAVGTLEALSGEGNEFQSNGLMRTDHVHFV